MNNSAPTVLPESQSTLSFSSLPLRSELLKNLVSLDFSNMTPIQAKSLPIMLNRSDVIAKAKTGSGKTAAFGLTILNDLEIKTHQVQALVLCPTRELADQVSQVLRSLARLLANVKVFNLSGGIPMRRQLDSLKHGAHIIVGTPGRIQKHLEQESLSLDNLQTVVLDEADKMLEMGFEDAIKKIISFCPIKRQTLLFSATYPQQIVKLAQQYMINPTIVTIDESKTALDITQIFYEVATQDDKFPLLKSILLKYNPKSTLIFCNTKDQTTQLASKLKSSGFSVIALNGDMEQAERDQAMILFANQSCSILVATDLAARGLDIKELPMVINFDLSFEYNVHIHRIGRTGRSGNKGIAVSLTTPADGQRLCLIEENTSKSIPWGAKDKLSADNTKISKPPMVTLCLSAGRKDKVRPGDILGALTKDAGLSSEFIGKIDISTHHSYVAIHQTKIANISSFIKNGKLKGRKIRAHLI
ncbi:MAG: ATP-dependent RNA helicase DbpA [Legionellaceae bacterium]|nr:ATP-dependent RNA helicase DbpA [Legionellaceae bacterium]